MIEERHQTVQLVEDGDAGDKGGNFRMADKASTHLTSIRIMSNEIRDMGIKYQE